MRLRTLPRALAALLLSGCASASTPSANPARGAMPTLQYTVDLNDRADDQFKVTLRVSGLTSANAIYQFAATAPGTYQVMDIGRYVRRFEAFDGDGRPVGVEKVSTNQYRLADPARVREIRYAVAETWDTPVTVNPIYRMCGTSLEADHALINGQGVFGFPAGLQSAPISVRLLRPAEWKVGTALVETNGVFEAENYDHLVDSPILLGRLTTARLDVTGVPVDIVVYSKTDQIQAAQLRDAMRGMLNAAGQFLKKLPVDRYTFLWHFEDQSAGAWEHSLSSEYVLREQPYTEQVGAQAVDIAAHEFFHIVTPLNIHSEIIEHFNFETPVPSNHLWLYEGTTEWASHKMQLEAGMKPAPGYLAEIVQKIRFDRAQFDTTYSLFKLAQTSFTEAGQRQYGNIYMRGAVVAGLLDIRLLELSGGKRGLKELIADPTQAYGKQRAFPEDSIVDIIVRRTDPSVRDFFARYVMGAERPPVKEYYAKLGINLVEDARGLPVRFEIDPNPTEAQRRLRQAWLGPNAARIP